MSDPPNPPVGDSDGAGEGAERLSEFDTTAAADLTDGLAAPEIDPPEGPTPDSPGSAAAADADRELRVLFARLVLLYKVGILATSLGALLFVFDRGPAVGTELLAGGLVMLGYALYETKRGKDRIDSGEFHDGVSRADEDGPSPSETADGGGTP